MATIDPPRKRRCLRCDRIEEWDDERGAWVARGGNGETRRGRKHCVHEWDITGNYNPIGTEP